ncbi:abortive infection bacteriophage resistance protein [Mycetocola sp. BIGb0189]|uniref:Abi family protein n=1 Tax=Mycetocola sp. BIGb0189 TaxID=2940604 RepID=UPI0021673569|nr:Abi family protein [Mycetocola sp. BIGb0189]MCS4277229.1 abortive infection bacteriophage resistance protein [Mycetocola sp. BIGb0189]
MSLVSTSPKKFLTLDEQIELLCGRGMVPSHDIKQWLHSVNYYRLSGYWHTYRVLESNGSGVVRRAERFIEGTSFTTIETLYEFDRKLRTLVHDGIERVEVALRSHLSYVLGASSPIAHTDRSYFRDGFDHESWMKNATSRVDRAARRSPVIAHHREKYGGVIPIWVLVDVLDFSDLSMLFDGMRAADQFAVAERLGIIIDPARLKPNQAVRAKKNHPLARWLEQLTVLRNIGAHHGRMWNRTLIPTSTAALRTVEDLHALPRGQSEQLFGGLTLMAKLIGAASPGSAWAQKVRREIEHAYSQLPDRSEREMGFPEGWRGMRLWSNDKPVTAPSRCPQ